MRTLYALASVLGGPGIGTTAYHAAAGLHRAGALAGLACLKNLSRDFDPVPVWEFPYLPDRLRRVMSDKLYYFAKNLRFDLALRTFLRNEKEGFDTLHAWNNQAGLTVVQARKMGIKVIIDRASSHINTQTRILGEAYARHGLSYKPYRRVIERCLRDYDEAHRVVVPSPFAFQSFLDEGFPKEKLALNPFGIDVTPQTPREHATTGDPFRLLFVGQVGIRKGVPDLLAAWDMLKLKDAELLLLGGMEPAARRIFAPWMRRKDVVFAGFSNKVSEHMARARVFCLPSLEEGSALVSYEAMSHGLPMILTEQVGAVAEEGRSTLIVPPGDPQALARAILELYEDKERAEKLGRAARRRVELFPWKAYGQRTAKLHQDLHA